MRAISERETHRVMVRSLKSVFLPQSYHQVHHLAYQSSSDLVFNGYLLSLGSTFNIADTVFYF